MSLINELYFLTNELFGHEKCVRSVCVLSDDRIVTGGIDNKIIIWNNLNNIWKIERQLTHHNKYILALEPSYIPIGHKNSEITFYSGGLEETIYRVSANNGRIVSRFNGHTSAICSLRESVKLRMLISGSWDSNVRIWNLDSSICIHVLHGHQYAVSIEIIHHPNYDQLYLLSGSQNKSLLLWKIPEAKLIGNYPNSHEDIIRSIDISKKIFENDTLVAVTVSNDCTIKIWQLYLEFEKENLILKTTEKYHESFIFDVKFSSHYLDRFFTASEDHHVVVWRVTDNFEIIPFQNLSFTSTIWSLAEMNYTDSLVTASEDCVCRIWTSSDSKTDLKKSEITKLFSLRTQENFDCRRNNHIKDNESTNFKDIPDICNINLSHSEEIRTVKLFNDCGVIKAFEHFNGNWKFIGIVSDVEGRLKKIRYTGDVFFPSGFYDFVLSIQLQDNKSFKELPFNYGDNIVESARKFCLREGVDESFCETICDLIVKDISSLNSASQFSKSFEPCVEYRLYKKFNINGLTYSLQKELENFRNSSDKIGELCKSENNLLETDIEYLFNFLSRFKCEITGGNEGLLVGYIKPTEMDIIYKRISVFIGINKLSIPIVDLWRILALHPQSSDIHKKTDQGWWLLALILKVINLISINITENGLKDDSEFCGSLFLICIRFFCNLFFNTTNREVMISKLSEILSSINKSITRIIENDLRFSTKESVNNNVILAYQALLLNYTIALNNRSCNSICSRNLIINMVSNFTPLIFSNSINCSKDILHYQLLILTNNYYFINELKTFENVYIIEDKCIELISNCVSKYGEDSSLITSNMLYRELISQLNICKMSKKQN
ncbi:PUL domain-containing protein [Cryptosporidium felis]|nr:PUL domain-containing protein [Cryptosporidium felis]